jgi:hypothetical protein
MLLSVLGPFSTVEYSIQPGPYSEYLGKESLCKIKPPGTEKYLQLSL